MDGIPLAIANGCFLLVFARTMFALGAGWHRRSLTDFGLMAAGFVFQTGHLYLRGQAMGRCPLGTLPDMLAFLGWSMVLIYMVVGTSYRMSLMGAFTAPFVLMTQIVASVVPRPEIGTLRPPPQPLVEFHAAVTMVSYGAFALACVAGVMFLIHDRQIKRHTLHPMFDQMPPITDLAVAIRRLLLVGVILLSAGIVSGFWAGFPPGKVAAGGGVWVIYSAILVAVHFRKLSARRVATSSIFAFAFALMTLVAIGSFGNKSH
jgi:ABC-type uncharacterized transport system permease subunit